MSGHGGGGGGSGEGEKVDCSTLRFRVSLSSPVPEVVSTLKPRDILTLKQEKKDGPLLAFTSSKKIAGSIAGASLLSLLRCIDDGYKYEAVVIKVEGGNVIVEVQPKKT